MSGKRLTPKQFQAMKAHLNEHDLWDQLYGEMAAHIEDVGVFAPAEPTDEEINEAIAKAQGWYRQGKKGSGLNEPSWFEDGLLKYGGDNYQPATNLTQALEALHALRETGYYDEVNDILLCCAVDGARLEWEDGYGNQTGASPLTPEQAARRLSRLLFERITNADGVNP